MRGDLHASPRALVDGGIDVAFAWSAYVELHTAGLYRYLNPVIGTSPPSSILQPRPGVEHHNLVVRLYEPIRTQPGQRRPGRATFRTDIDAGT